MPARVLITSVGSGVSQAVLDVMATRQDDVEIIGVNSHIEGVPEVHRFHLVPPLVDASFASTFCDILAQEDPDLVIAGRDDDVVMLAGLADAGALSYQVWTGGGGELAARLRDKSTAYAFARDHGLPFVHTVTGGEPDADGALHDLIDAGGPWIGKPRRGHGSRGVTLLVTPEEVCSYLSASEGVVQRALHSVQDGHTHLKGATWEADAQIIIGVDGRVMATATFTSLMVEGVSTRVRPLDNGPLSDLAGDYARVLAEHGWRGPVNVQALWDEDRRWQVIEINPRFSGGCLHRYRCGFDEVGIVLASWLGRD